MKVRGGPESLARGAAYPIGQGPHHAVIILSAGVIESLELELWTPPELLTSRAKGPTYNTVHMTYIICCILITNLNVCHGNFFWLVLKGFKYCFVFNIYVTYMY